MQCQHKSVNAYGHNKKDGRGVFGKHCECTLKGCEFNDDAWLWDSIKGDCYYKCDGCKRVQFARGNYQFSLMN